MFCNLQFSITIYSKAVEFEEEKTYALNFYVKMTLFHQEPQRQIPIF
jgi:hypothetical protein